MKTRLIAISKPLNTIEGNLTPEEFISYIARVSNPANQLNTETAPRLLRYLIKHKHWSPFEHVSCTFEIVTSRAIAAQILRHRSFTFQEFSQRYAQAHELEPIQWRKQGKTNRQVGDEEVTLPSHLEFAVKEAQRNTKALYDQLINEGIAKESARMILPLSTQTTIYMTGSLRSWIHYIELRTEKGTQKEHRDIADMIKISLAQLFPSTFTAIDELNKESPTNP